MKIENENMKKDEEKYKNKISELFSQITLLKEEKQKNMILSEKNEELSEKNKNLENQNQILENNYKSLNAEKDQIYQLLKEKNKELRDNENNNILLRKDLDIINEKLKEFINENDSIKKLNKDLFEEKNDLEKKYKNLNEQNEKIRINLGNMENEQKLIIADNNNLKYLNLINEKKIYMANCEIQEMDKTIKYLKKNLEQIKLTNSNYLLKNNKLFCCQCGCLVNNYDNRECEINKLIEDNKVLFKINRDLKNKLDKITMNLNSNKNNDDLN
jgi:chromosome segregation protein